MAIVTGSCLQDSHVVDDVMRWLGSDSVGFSSFVHYEQVFRVCIMFGRDLGSFVIGSLLVCYDNY